jgi:hypothetical protein
MSKKKWKHPGYSTSNLCMETSGTGWICWLKKGHKGKHEAWGGIVDPKPYYVWKSERGYTP